MSESPHGHVSAQDAARALALSDERIRQLVRSGALHGQRLVAEDGSSRYWVEVEDLKRLQAERQRPARVEDLENAQEISRELALRAVAEIIAKRLQMSTHEITGEIASQREEVTRLLSGIVERQIRLLHSLNEGVNEIEEQSKKMDARSELEKSHQERVRKHEEEIIEITNRAINEARKPPVWMVGAILLILGIVFVGIIFITLILFQTHPAL